MGGFAEWLFLVERSLVDPAVLDTLRAGVPARLGKADPTHPRSGVAADVRGNAELSGAGQERTGAVDSSTTSSVRWCATAATTSTMSRMPSSGSASGCCRPSVKREQTGEPSSTSTRLAPLTCASVIRFEVLFKVYLQTTSGTSSAAGFRRCGQGQRTGTLSIGYGKRDRRGLSRRDPGTDAERRTGDAGGHHGTAAAAFHARDAFGQFVPVDLRGEGTRAQRSRFGYTKADSMRKMIVQVIQQYAHQTRNWHLLRLLDRFRDFRGNRPDPARQASPTAEAIQACVPARRAGLPEHRGRAGEARQERVDDDPRQSPAAMAGTTATRPVVAAPEPPLGCAGKDGGGRRAGEAGGEVCAGAGVRQVSRHAGAGCSGVRVACCPARLRYRARSEVWRSALQRLDAGMVRLAETCRQPTVADHVTGQSAVATKKSLNQRSSMVVSSTRPRA